MQGSPEVNTSGFSQSAQLSTQEKIENLGFIYHLFMSAASDTLQRHTTHSMFHMPISSRHFFSPALPGKEKEKEKQAVDLLQKEKGCT